MVPCASVWRLNRRSYTNRPYPVPVICLLDVPKTLGAGSPHRVGTSHPISDERGINSPDGRSEMQEQRSSLFELRNSCREDPITGIPVRHWVLQRYCSGQILGQGGLISRFFYIRGCDPVQRIPLNRPFGTRISKRTPSPPLPVSRTVIPVNPRISWTRKSPTPFPVP